MRLLITSTHAGSGWGGSEELWAAVAEAAVEADHEVALLLPHKGLDAHPRLRTLAERGVKFYNTTKIQGSRRRMAWYAAVGAKKFVSSFSPEMTLISLSGTFTYDQGFLNRATIDLIQSTGQKYVLVNELARQRDRFDMNRVKTARALYGESKAALFVSRANMELVQRQIMLDLPHAAVTQNPANLKNLEQMDWPGDGPVRLACVARYDLSDKGQDRLLFALADPRWKERDWTLDFYGRGADEPLLRELVRYLNLEDRVRVNEHAGDIRELWSKHHMLVLPSHDEGLPLVLVEAMYCGRPAMATRAGGMAERVAEGETGFLAEAPTPRLLDDTLERAWARKHEWQQLGATAREHILAKQDPQPGKSLLEYLADLSSGGPVRTGEICKSSEHEPA